MSLTKAATDGDDVKYFAKKFNNVVMWKGTNLSVVNFKVSDNQRNLVLGNAKHYKEALIYMLYSQKNKQENYFYINPDISEDVVNQLIAVKPNPGTKFGDLPCNWEAPNGAPDHFFDVAKEMMFARDFALSCFKRSRYRFGQAKSIIHRFEKSQKQREQRQITDVKNSFWSV